MTTNNQTSIASLALKNYYHTAGNPTKIKKQPWGSAGAYNLQAKLKKLRD